MKFSEAFNLTLEEFGITGKEVAQRAGVREATVSDFRRGNREIQTGNLEKLIGALPTDAKQFLFLKLLVGGMNAQGIATLLSAIAHQIKNDNNSLDSAERYSANSRKSPTEAALSLR